MALQKTMSSSPLLPVVRLLLGSLLLAGLASCTNQEYSECDDESCYTCDGVGCRDVSPPDRSECDCGRACLGASTCTDLGCTATCSVEADCPAGSTCRDGLCLGFVSSGVREVASAIDCSCVLNSDCADGLICRESECVAGCRTTDDCSGADVCVDGMCVPTVTPDCSATAPCTGGLECVEGECRAPSDTCQFNSECGAGRVCINQECTTECDVSRPCPTGASCNGAGYCQVDPRPIDVCVVNADCDAGEVCRDGACYDACTLDAECGAGRYCQEGRCRVDTRPRPTCGPTRNCASGSVCLNGTCRIPCSTAPECAAFDVQYNFCLDSLCATTNEATSDCAAQVDCSGTDSCIDGICR